MKLARIIGNGALAVAAGTLYPAQAQAQVAVGVTAISDFRLRGLSLNGGGLAVTGEVAYDDESGVYAGASVTGGDTRRFGTEFLNHSEYLGYARRIDSDVTVDVGISNTQVYSNVFRRFSGNYSEIYAGLSTEQVSAHVYFSPSFISPGLRTAYFDLNATLRPAKRLRAFGHVGVLVPLGGDGELVVPKARYDLRLGVVAELGRHELQLAWIRTGASTRFLDERKQSCDALVIAASMFF